MKGSINYILIKFLDLLVVDDEPTLQPPSKIQDDEIESTNANTNDPSRESENKESYLIYLMKPKKETMFLDGDQVNSLQEITYSKKKLLLYQIWIMLKQLIYFKMFWNDELTELIAEQRNICSFQKLGKIIQVTKEEIEQFIIIQIYMSILKLPAYHLYCLKKCTMPQ